MHVPEPRRTTRRLATTVAFALIACVVIVAPAAQALQTAIRVDAGGYHTCAVKGGGGLVCWGYNSNGQTKPDVGSRFRSVSSGGLHSCAVKRDDTVRCWGANTSGQAPSTVSGTFANVSAGGAHTCGLELDRSITCWGDNSYGQAPASIGGSYTSVSAGDVHTCAVKNDQSIACWGWNDHGRAPASVAGNFTSVSAGGGHTCAVTTGGTVACWGVDRYGQATPPGGGFRSVSSGSTHTCGVRLDSTIACWGRSSYGEAPPSVAGDFVSVSSGDAHTCALRSDGLVQCWGDDSSRQLGAAPDPPAPAPPGAPVGDPYSASFTSKPGVPQGIFQITGGVLPSGLSLGPRGTISGTPTASGTFSFTVTATNVIGHVSRTFSITTGTVSSDFALTQSGPATAPIGATFDTTVTLTNNGPSSAGGSVHLATSEPVKLVSIAKPSTVSCSKDPGTALSATCSFSGTGALAPGATLALTIGLASGKAQSITLDANAGPAAGVIDPAPANNSSSTSTEAVPERGTEYTSVGDAGFAKPKVSVPVGRTVFWNDTGPSSHTVADATRLSLFSLIGEQPVAFGEYRFVAAGAYTVKDGLERQLVRVRILRSAKTGATSTTFVLKWAVEPAPANFTYVIEIKRPGASGWQGWKKTAWRKGRFTPDAGTGRYWFRARYKRTTDGAATGWITSRIEVR